MAAEPSESFTINNAIATFIIKYGYGYPVETREVTFEESQELLVSGEIDLLIEGEEFNRGDWYSRELAAGNIINLGPMYEGRPQFFVIPKRTALKENIVTIQDMLNRADLVEGVFFNCPFDSPCAKINEVKLEAYGFLEDFTIQTPASFSDLAGELDKTQKEFGTIFGYYLSPTVLMRQYQWQILEEPPYTEACWKKVLDASAGRIQRPIDEACAYPAPAINKIASSGLMEKAPEVVEMLEQMNIGILRIEVVMNFARDRQVDRPERMAVEFLRNNIDWKNWMPPEISEKVRREVERQVLP